MSIRFTTKKIDPKEMSVSPPNVLIKFLDVSLVKGVKKNSKNPNTFLTPVLYWPREEPTNHVEVRHFLGGFPGRALASG
jgi:hypothetical protein